MSVGIHKGDWILQRPGHVYGANVFDLAFACLSFLQNSTELVRND